MKKKLFLTCVTVFTIFSIFSQEKYGHVTPQTAEFIKHGSFPVSLYTGKINISIPVYHYKDPDFDIPVSISYGSDGFQPMKHSGFVGHDWILNAGGCITREVYNMPDEYKKTTNLEANYPNGFLIQTRAELYDKNAVFNYQSSVGIVNSQGGFSLKDGSGYTDNYDYMPDMFTFNFNGNSGNFIIGNDGQVRVISEQYLKVDLSGVQGFTPETKKYLSLTNTSNNQEISEIKITDMKGYQYFFGGNLNAVEYNIGVETGVNGENADNSNNYQLTPAIMAWHLTKIIAPNGRIANFDYTPHQSGTEITKNDPIWMFKKYITNIEINAGGSSTSSVTLSTFRFRQSATKSVVMKEIRVDDVNFKLTFNKSLEQKKLYYSGVDFCNHNYQLNSVTATIDNTIISNCTLNYDYVGGNNYWGRRFLKEVIRFDGGKYQFNYNDNGTFPSTDELFLGTLDDYGYWKANNQLGMIKSIIYPTGGKSEFEFEPHDYGLRRIYELSNNKFSHNVENMSTATLSGGVRIKKIKNFINNIQQDEKLYNYTTDFTYENTLPTVDENGNNYNGNPPAGNECLNFNYNQITGLMESELCEDSIIELGTLLPKQRTPSSNSVKSTGILHSNWILVNMLNGNSYLVKGDRSQNYNIAEPHIGYSQISEITKNLVTNEKTYAVNEFSDYVNQMDQEAKNLLNTSEIDLNYVFRYQHAYSSMSHKRGKLLNINKYSTDIQLKQNIQNSYANVNTNLNLIFEPGSQIANADSVEYIVTLHNFWNFSIARKIFIQPVNLISEFRLDIFENSTIQKQTTYEYDNLFRLFRESEKSSNGNWLYKQYKYADNILGAPYNQSNPYALGCNLLKNKHMLGVPIETITGITEGTVDKVTGASVVMYKPVGSVPAPSAKLELNIKHPVSDYVSINLNSDTLQYDNRMKSIAGFEFNQLLRMTKISVEGELPLFYTWDSKNLYPIKEIQGDMETNYTYKPLVGMSSKTDPRGFKTYYEYDGANRLKNIFIIENGEKKILQHFYYKYANQ